MKRTIVDTCLLNILKKAISNPIYDFEKKCFTDNCLYCDISSDIQVLFHEVLGKDGKFICYEISHKEIKRIYEKTIIHTANCIDINKAYILANNIIGDFQFLFENVTRVNINLNPITVFLYRIVNFAINTCHFVTAAVARILLMAYINGEVTDEDFWEEAGSMLRAAYIKCFIDKDSYDGLMKEVRKWV